MDFNMQNDKGEKYALLYPLYEQNEELKKAADEIGAKSALVYDRNERGFRLYESKVPEKTDVDAIFGKYATEEAKAASVAEREKVDQMKTQAARATGAEVDESKVYYPAKGNGDKEAFNKLREEKGTKFVYSSRMGGFVHREGPTEGFERFQTPEAKAAWQAEFTKNREASERRRDVASEGVDVMAERANGRDFLADNSKGFMLPSKSQEAVRKSQIDAMKKASDEELSQVFKITEGAKKALERKQYGIQVNAAKNRGVSVEDFNKMDPAKRREAANFVGLNKEDFSKLAALTAGFFGIRDELVDRGLLESRETARALQNEAGQGQTGNTAKEMKPESTQEKAAAGEEKKTEGKARGNKLAAALAAGAEAQGVGR